MTTKTIISFILLSAFACTAALANSEARPQTTADDNVSWLLVTDNGISMPVNLVNCLVAADDETTFCVMLVNGGMITNVNSVTFNDSASDAISSPTAEGKMLIANEKLQFCNLPEGSTIGIYAQNGSLIASQSVEAFSPSTIDISNLSSGTYIVKTANGTFKFIKK